MSLFTPSCRFVALIIVLAAHPSCGALDEAAQDETPGGSVGWGKADGPEGTCEAAPTMNAVFSPQPYAQSHLPAIITIIDGAKQSLDIAMYNLSDNKIVQALGKAIGRGVKVRFLSENAQDDRKAPSGTISAKLEDLGVDVRYVNKIMHHKFMIADGPRTEGVNAACSRLVSGSGNWSQSAATIYDENTVFLSGVPRLVMMYQQEFNLLWSHSSDLSWSSSIVFDPQSIDLSSTLAQDPSSDALFTSANFTVKEGSTTFRRADVPDAIAAPLVEAILSAQSSIHIASGHLRSRPVSEALMAAKKARPTLDIRVYLDGQEYISASGDNEQLANLDACLKSAGDSESKKRDCTDKGFLFSYEVSQAGIELRYKYYAYRWDMGYAKQMHNKLIIIDGTTLFTGSYNLSDNAEHNTFENMLVLRAPAFQQLIDSYESTFEALWSTDEDRSLLADLRDKVSTSDTIPLVFSPMALTWAEVTDLKQLIYENCPKVQSVDYQKNPTKHTTCPR
jgi:phosphatidylserine/phosphatidylglycerophosphate/cardiolipin synthase-like enzyme